MHRTRSIASILVFLALVAASCSRSGDEETGTVEETTSTTSESGGLNTGDFGDLKSVCQDGDASGATATGVTETQIRLGTMTDKGFAGAQGLNKEMYDAAVAFTTWCNERGGILGRELVVDDLDVKLFEYEARIIEACESEFALVGGGAVFDEDPKDLRVGCGLANIAGYVVSARGRVAGLQVQPLPNPIYSMASGHYRRIAELYPDAVGGYAVMASNLPAVLLVRDQSVEAATTAGFTEVYRADYAPQGETGWQNFVREMRDKDVKILDFIGQPETLTALAKAMDTEGWYPDVITTAPNFYDEKFAVEGGAVAGNTLIRSAYHPFELAEDNQATADYLQLMDEYNPGGKKALLGAQSISSWLMFATAATACGNDLTRECLLEEAAALKSWTGGGLHSEQTPGNSDAGQCFLFLSVDAEGFHYEQDATDPTDGLFNCNPANVTELKGDYGVPKPAA